MKYATGKKESEKPKKNKKNKNKKKGNAMENQEKEFPTKVIDTPIDEKEVLKEKNVAGKLSSLISNLPSFAQNLFGSKPPVSTEIPKEEDNYLDQLLREEEAEKEKKMKAEAKKKAKKQREIDALNKKIEEEEQQKLEEEEALRKKKAEYKKNKRKRAKNKQKNPCEEIQKPQSPNKVSKNIQICHISKEKNDKIIEEAKAIEKIDKKANKGKKKNAGKGLKAKPTAVVGPKTEVVKKAGPLTIEEIMELDKQKMKKEAEHRQKKKKEEYNKKMKPLLGMI